MWRNILNVTANMHRWKLSALAAAAFVSAALTTTNAAALALGPLNVQSALGENLRAEISIPQATAAELNSLVAQIASPDVFRAQGMDYSGAARSIQVQLQRNADGSASLRLTSNAPIQDPFVDLVVSTQWSTGQIARSYTLLLDPPAAERNTSISTTAPQITPAASSPPSTYSSATAARPRAAAAPATPAVRAQTVTPAPVRPAPSASPTAVAAPASTPTDAESSLRVRTGDTAGRIANSKRPSGVSLDQMLVAMLRSNPEAFINGNVNRIRAGAVVQMPNREAALSTSVAEARQIVAAQSRDFNAYRRGLASKAPQATVQAADRTSSGQVQAQISDTRPAADTPDKLTLSKGAMQNAAAAEAQLAAQKQSADQDNRLNELQRNLAELNQLAQNTATPANAPVTATTQEAVTPTPAADATQSADSATPQLPAVDIANANAAAVLHTPAADAPSAPAISAGDTTDTPAEAAPLVPAETPADTPVAKPAPATPIPASVPVPTESLLDNPLLPAAGGVVALLLGLLGYSAWKRRRTAAEQAALIEDAPLPADSFIGGSGGQQVDTSSSDEGASTMAYAPSQLDGGGDVDPVAEADVYLAYGRDVQAEEILKEALRSQPERLSIHVKLAEIYVKRQDINALQAVAQGMQPVSQGQGVEWQRVVEMGRHMDPSNAYFASLAHGAAAGKPTSSFAAALNAAQPAAAAWGTATAATTDAVAPADAALDAFDLNLDLPPEVESAEDALKFAHPQTRPLPSATPTPQPSEDDFAALNLSTALDSQLDMAAAPALQDPPALVQDTLMAEAAAPDAHDLSGLDLDLSGFELPTQDPTPTPATEATDTGLQLDFDTSSLEAPAQDIAVPALDDVVLENHLPLAPLAASESAAPNATGLDFDLGALDLDLGDNASPAAAAEPVHNLADDPLSTKLDLAQEFNAIGDSEGARALIEEVMLEASGPLKDRAQKLLSELD